MTGRRPEARPLALDRVDLADIHAPERLAGAIHIQLGPLDAAVPLGEIARALDIGEVRQARFEHFNLEHLSWSKPAAMT